MTKTELDLLRGYVRKELITDNSYFLDRQNNQFQEGWYASVRDMEIYLDNLKEDSPDLEKGKFRELLAYIDETYKTYKAMCDEYDIYDMGRVSGFEDCSDDIEGWINDNVFNSD